MTTKWGFLEPWRTVLRDNLILQGNGEAAESTLQVLFTYPEKYSMRPTICLRCPENRRDAARLQQLREAMELFTQLAFVKSKVYQEMMIGLGVAQLGENTIYPPIWDLRCVGTRSHQAVTALQTEVTWGALLGLLNDPVEYSPEFQAAVQQLEAIGVDEATLARVESGPAIYWRCKFHGSTLEGRQKPAQLAETSTTILGHVRSLFNVSIPPIVRLCATRDGTALVTTWKPATKPCETVIARLRVWDHPAFSALLSALARTATINLRLYLGGVTINSRQAILNIGLMMNTLLCRNVVCLVTQDGNKPLENPIRVTIGETALQCSRADNSLFAAICSAVAALSAEAHLDSLLINLEDSGRWPWLIYAICGGTSEVVVPWVKIWKGTLTKTDILAMRAALRANYPQPVAETRHNNSCQYGLVEIEEGTELHLCGALGGEDDSSIVMASACQFRALLDPNDSKRINLVVPGYGACKANLGDRGVRFTADTVESELREKRLCGALDILYVQFETPGVLIDLLVLVTRRLHSLKLYFHTEDTTPASRVDLCALARACPDLQSIAMLHATVCVSEHDAALCRWPAKMIELEECSCSLSDLVGCLRNPKLRMARELVKLAVTPRLNEAFDEQAERELVAHNGEFLPLVKEKLPRSSKAAVISAVMTWTKKPTHRLDAYILSLVFVFASTPVQRSVKSWIFQI